MTRQIIGANNIPQRSATVDGIKFRLEHYLEISDENNRVVLNPIEQDVPKYSDSIGIAQILLLVDRIRIYASTYSKPGALLSYDFFKDKFKLEFRKKIDTRFWTLGLLGDRNEKGIAIGAGDDIGIRFFNFNKGTLDGIVGDEETENELRYAFYTLFQNPPQIQDGKFYISHLDSQGDFLCHDRNFQLLITGKMVRDIRRRLNDPKLDRVLEICIDDEMIKRGYGGELLQIKEDAGKSYFLYNTNKQPPSQVIIISEGISDYVKNHYLEKK